MLIFLLACAADEPATLAQVQADVFTASCAFSTCHGAASGAGDLDLRDGFAHDALVGVEASGRAGAVRVVAGDPDGSYLVEKCTEGGDFDGDPMPGEGGLDETRLALLRSWIAAGAAP